MSRIFIPKLGPSFWHKLYCFYYTAHFESYSQAALALRIHQSSLSRAVQGLEARLGKVLLLRNRRGLVKLTTEGQAIWPHVHHILAELKEIEGIF